MKVLKKITIFSLLVASIIFSSCEDDFLDKVPTDSVASTSATETTGNLDLIINGINRSLYVRYGAQGRTGIGSMMIQMETLGEDYVNVARANGWFIGTGQWLSHTDASSANCEFPYRTHYQIIRNANTVINLGNEAVGPEEDKNKAIAQALTYRAWSYFWIVQLYGERYVPGAVNSQLGVPLRLDLGTEPIARNTVEEVYTQINQDLDDAIVLFGDVTNSTGGSSLTSNVANGLKARVNLVQGNYAIAAQFAEAAQEGPTLMNTADYFNNFSNASSGEWMWGSVIQEDQTDLFGNFGAWISRNFSSSNIRGNPKAINSLLYDQISDTDVRKSLFDPTGEHLTLPAGVEISGRHSRFPYTNQKFVAAGEGDSRMDTPYMRVSEMYLIEAEAKAKLGDDAGAASALFDMAVARDPSYTLSVNTGQDLIDEILVQRRIELWGEGFRFFDLKRLDMALDRNGGNHDAVQSLIFDVPAGDPRWTWLIPQDALNANELLVQN